MTESAEKVGEQNDHHQHGYNLDAAMENVKLKKIYEIATILNNVESNPNSVVDKDYYKVKQFMIENNQMFSDQFDCLNSMMLKKVIQNLNIKLYSKTQMLFSKGDKADNAYLVLHGEVGFYAYDFRRCPNNKYVKDRRRATIVRDISNGSKFKMEIKEQQSNPIEIIDGDDLDVHS